MKQQVIITLAVKQEFIDSDSDSMELVTQGQMWQDKDCIHLSYEESEMTGLGGTTTHFFIEPEQITLTRQGTVQSVMVFQDKKRHQSLYQTSYGAMDVEVHTTFFAHNMDETGGRIQLDYNYEVSKNVIGKNRFDIGISLAKSPTHSQT